MKGYIQTCFLGMMFFALNANTQVIHRDLLQKKYSSQQIKDLILTQGKWKPFPQTPEEWKAHLPDSVINLLISNGEHSLNTEFPTIPATIALEYTRNGNRINYEARSFAKRNQLWDLVMAESVEGKGRFTDRIVDGIWSICEETFWGVPAHLAAQKAGSGLPDVEDPVVDLFAAETAADLAWTDYFIGPQLDKVSKLIRARIFAEINRRIFVPMAGTKFGWMGHGDPNSKLNNWAPWIMSNYLVADLLLQKDGEKKVQGINLVMKITDQYINGLGEDGACDEGPSYWAAAGGCVFDVLTILQDVSKGKISIYQEPIIQKMASYIYKTHISGKYFVNVADAHPQTEPEGVMIYRFGKALNDHKLATFGSWVYHTYGNDFAVRSNRFRNSRILYNLMALKEIAVSDFLYTDVENAWFDDVQLMVARLPNGLLVSGHGGTNGESHNHNDVGDFTIYADGDPVIIDIGSGTYTSKTFSDNRYSIWYNTSAYHNLPTINNTQQEAGIKYAASNVQYRASTSSSILSMNIENSYPPETGLSKWQRTITAYKKGNIDIEDTYVLSPALNSLTQTFMTVCNTEISQPGKIIFTTAHGSKVFLSYDPLLWSIQKDKMELLAPEDQALKVTWQHADIYRILLISKLNPFTGKRKYTISK